MILAIHQPHYLPWCGYLDKMDRADLFVLLDTVPFTKGDWQNRNRFKTAQGWQWVTVPVLHDSGQLIRDVRVDPNREEWARKHRNALTTDYGATPHYQDVHDLLDPVWQEDWERLSPLAGAVTEALARFAGISTPIRWASELDPTPDEPDGRLISICRQVGAHTYLAGPDGPSYMDMGRWMASGIGVEVQSFEHPVYDQPFGGFLPGMSCVDLLCNCGPGAVTLLRAANGRDRKKAAE
jgi:hypothetical protein